MKENTGMEIFIYSKAGKELRFDKYEAHYDESNEVIYYNRDMHDFSSQVDTVDIGKVIEGACFLTERNDKLAAELFVKYYDEQIEKLQDEIAKLRENQETTKVIWYRNDEGILEETDF